MTNFKTVAISTKRKMVTISRDHSFYFLRTGRDVNRLTFTNFNLFAISSKLNTNKGLL